MGACDPKPPMPSWTIVPSSTATSTTREPHCPPMVGMSTPWSSLHQLGGATREVGRSGNTQPVMSVDGAGGGAGSKTLTTTRLALERMPLSFTTLTRPVWGAGAPSPRPCSRSSS